MFSLLVLMELILPLFISKHKYFTVGEPRAVERPRGRVGSDDNEGLLPLTAVVREVLRSKQRCLRPAGVAKQ